MKRLLAPIVAISLGLILSGCLTAEQMDDVNAQVRMTPEQLKILQTKVYNITDCTKLMKATVTAFQSIGYQIKNTDSAMGIVTAEISEDHGETRPFALMGTGLYHSHSIYQATANISSLGNSCQIILTVNENRYNQKGSVMDVQPIKSPKFYGDFFAKITQELQGK